VNVVSEGYDIKRFLEALVKEKSKIILKFIFLESIPNIDFFTREELRSVVRKFK